MYIRTIHSHLLQSRGRPNLSIRLFWYFSQLLLHQLMLRHTNPLEYNKNKNTNNKKNNNKKNKNNNNKKNKNKNKKTREK